MLPREPNLTEIVITIINQYLKLASLNPLLVIVVIQRHALTYCQTSRLWTHCETWPTHLLALIEYHQFSATWIRCG